MTPGTIYSFCELLQYKNTENRRRRIFLFFSYVVWANWSINEPTEKKRRPFCRVDKMVGACNSSNDIPCHPEPKRTLSFTWLMQGRKLSICSFNVNKTQQLQ